MVLLALAPSLPFGQPWESILRVGVLTLVLVTLSGDVIRSLRIRHVLASVALGVAVCAMWVAPDLLVPGWRTHFSFPSSAGMRQVRRPL